MELFERLTFVLAGLLQYFQKTSRPFFFVIHEFMLKKNLLIHVR